MVNRARGRMRWRVVALVFAPVLSIPMGVGAALATPVDDAEDPHIPVQLVFGNVGTEVIAGGSGG